MVDIEKWLCDGLLDENYEEFDVGDMLENMNYKFVPNVMNQDLMSELENIVEQVKKYNVLDFIIKLSSLYVLPENQSKTVVLDPLMQSLLNLDSSFFNNTKPMSYGRFKTVIRSLNELSFSSLIDPIEYPFVQDIRFLENYMVFNGINNLASERLQNLINSCLMPNNKLPLGFKEFVRKILKTTLGISNNVAQNMLYTINNSMQLEKREIFVPSKSVIDNISQNLVFTLRDLDTDFAILEDYFTTIADEPKDVETLGWQLEYEYYFKPFLKFNDMVIVLNVTILSSFLFHAIICKANAEHCIGEVTESYNEYGFFLMHQYMYRIGYREFSSGEETFKLIDNTEYKEAIFAVDRNSVILVLYSCFDGEYSNNTMFQNNISSFEHDDISNQRLGVILDFLKNEEIQNIYTIVVVNPVNGEWRIAALENLLLLPFLVIDLNDLQYVAIHEDNNKDFLPYYMLSKERYQFASTSFSELNLITQYKNKKRSFYFDDNIDIRSVQMFYPGYESVDYVIEAISKENRKVVKSPYGYYCEVVLKDAHYVDGGKTFVMCKPRINRVTMLNEFRKFSIWLYTEEMEKPELAEIYWSIVDVVTYWIGECSEIFKPFHNINMQVKVEFKFEGSCSDYYTKSNEQISWKETVVVNICNNNITFIIRPESYIALACDDNGKEKEMMIFILENILNIYSIEIKNVMEIVNKVFENRFKKKMYVLNDSGSGFYPVSIPEIAMISSYDVEILLDCIGDSPDIKQLLNKTHAKYIKTGSVGREVVGFLFNLLKTEIEKYDGESLLCYALKQMERCRFDLYIKKERYLQDSLCFPEMFSELNSSLSKDNSLSVALSFLIEFLSATPPVGERKPSLFEFNKLLAICNQIIEWAYVNDLFNYKLVKEPIEVLGSGRIGFDKVNANKLYALEMHSYIDMLKKQGSGKYEQINKKLCEDYFEDLSNAFEIEAGCSLRNMMEIIFEIKNCTIDMSNIVKKMTKTELTKLIMNNNSYIQEKDIEVTIDFISLKKREDFLSPPDPYRKEDVYPWRFNRELSFIRRPLINCGDVLIWGNNSLVQWAHYVLDSVLTGRYKAQTEGLGNVIGKISNTRGRLFNDLVFDILREKGFDCHPNVKKINSKKIADDASNLLGDIDILLIDREKSCIMVIEVKDFKMARNNYELYQQNKDIFVDEKKLSYMTKHNRRVQWIEDHIDDVIAHFELKSTKMEGSKEIYSK